MTDATDLTFSINSNRRNDVLNERRAGLIWTIRMDTICQLIKSPSIGKDTCAFTRNVKGIEHTDFQESMGHPSTSSSTFDQPSSSHLNDDDDDGNDKGTSRASTPSPIRYVNSLTNQVP
ncbi:hypothetical protein Tco_1273766 [Tanacetum coccineum]